MPPIINKKKFQKIVSAFALVCFSGSSVYAQPEIQYIKTIQAAPQQESRLFSLAETLQVPEALGTVKERFVPETPSASTMIHIQDAHGSREAQSNTKKILEYLNENYGTGLFFLEGALGEIQTQRLKFFEDKKLNQKAADLFARHALIGGTELSLVEIEKKGGSAQAFGIEDADLYKKNLQDFREVLSRQESASRYLERLRSEIFTQSSRVFNKDLKSFFSEWRAFQENPEGLARHLSALETHARRHAGIDLRNPETQIEWPQLFRLIRLKELEPKLNRSKILKESSRLQNWIKEEKIEAADFVQLLQSLEDSKIKVTEPRLKVEGFFDLARGKQFSFQQYPELSLCLGKRILEDEIRPMELFEEMNRLGQKLLEKLAETQEEEKLTALYADYLSLKKLFKLELSREEYLALLARRSEVSPSALGERLGAAFRNEGKQLADVESLFKNAESFYQGAIARESAMMRRILERMKEKDEVTSVFVTGGFHSRGLFEQIKQQGLAYVEIMPRISNLNDTNDYMKVMMLQGAPGAVSHAHQPSYADSGLAQLGAPIAPFIEAEAARILRENFPGQKTHRRSEVRGGVQLDNAASRSRSGLRFLEKHMAEFEAREGVKDGEVVRIYQPSLAGEKPEQVAAFLGSRFDYLEAAYDLLGVGPGDSYFTFGIGTGRDLLAANLRGVDSAHGEEFDLDFYNAAHRIIYGLESLPEAARKQGISDFREDKIEIAHADWFKSGILSPEGIQKLKEYSVFYYFIDGSERQDEMFRALSEHMSPQAVLLVHDYWDYKKTPPGLREINYVIVDDEKKKIIHRWSSSDKSETFRILVKPQSPLLSLKENKPLKSRQKQAMAENIRSIYFSGWAYFGWMADFLQSLSRVSEVIIHEPRKSSQEILRMIQGFFKGPGEGRGQVVIKEDGSWRVILDGREIIFRYLNEPLDQFSGKLPHAVDAVIVDHPNTYDYSGGRKDHWARPYFEKLYQNLNPEGFLLLREDVLYYFPKEMEWTRKEKIQYLGNWQKTLPEHHPRESWRVFKRSESRTQETSQTAVLQEPIYLAVYKPQEVLSTPEDASGANRRTVFDMVRHKLGYIPEGLYAAGRLDFDVDGLMVLTNDGSYFSALLPRAHRPKTYQVEFKGEFTEEQAQRLRDGVEIRTKNSSGEEMIYKTKPAEVKILRSSRNSSQVELVIREGKYHQVKEMFKVVGVPNIRLKRTGLGRLSLVGWGLKPGDVVQLARARLEAVLKDRDDSLAVLDSQVDEHPKEMIRQYFTLLESQERSAVKDFGEAKLLEIAKKPKHEELFWNLWMRELFFEQRELDEALFYSFFTKLTQDYPQASEAALKELRLHFSDQDPPKEFSLIEGMLKKPAQQKMAAFMLIRFMLENRKHLMLPDLNLKGPFEQPRDLTYAVAVKLAEKTLRFLNPKAGEAVQKEEFLDPVSGKAVLFGEAVEIFRKWLDGNPEFFDESGWIKIKKIRPSLLPLLNHGTMRGDWGGVWNGIRRSEVREEPQTAVSTPKTEWSMAVPAYPWLRHALFFNPIAFKNLQLPALAMGVDPKIAAANVREIALEADVRLKRKVGAPWFEPTGWLNKWTEVWMEEADRQKGNPEEATALFLALFYQMPNRDPESLYSQIARRLYEIYPRAREKYYQSIGQKVFVKRMELPFAGAPLPAYLVVPEKSLGLPYIPAVILQHGFTSRKEQPYFNSLEEKQIEKGYAVIRPELPGHGEHFGNHFMPNKTYLNYFLDTITQKLELSSSLFPVEGNGKEHAVTIVPEAFFGHSFGGYLGFLAHENKELFSRLKAIAAQGAPFEDAFHHPENWLFNYWDYLKVFFESDDYRVIVSQVKKLAKEEKDIPLEHLDRLLVQMGKDDILAAPDYDIWHRVFDMKSDHVQVYPGEKHYLWHQKKQAFEKADEFISSRVRLPKSGKRSEARGEIKNRIFGLVTIERVIKDLGLSGELEAGGDNRLGYAVSAKDEARLSARDLIGGLNRVKDGLREYEGAWAIKIHNPNGDRQTYILEISPVQFRRRSELRVASQEAVEEIYRYVAQETLPLALSADSAKTILEKISASKNTAAGKSSAALAVLKESLGEYAWLVERSEKDKPIRLILPVDGASAEAKDLALLLNALRQPNDIFYVPVMGNQSQQETFAAAFGNHSGINLLAIAPQDGIRTIQRLAVSPENLSASRGAAGQDALLEPVGHIREFHRMKADELEESVAALLAAAYLREAGPEAPLGVQNLAQWMKSKGINPETLSAKVLTALQALSAIQSAA